MKTIRMLTMVFLASFVVVLTLVGSVATGKLVFLDGFEDGSATDGAPVTWSPVPGFTGSFDVIGSDYVLTRPTDREEMYCYVDQYMNLADTSIRTQARLIPGGWWFGLGVRANLGEGFYIALLKNNERLEIWRFASSSWALASANVGIDPRSQDVLLRFDVIGNELSAWAWREGDPMPAEPQVTAVNSDFVTGGIVVAADLGSRLSNNEAIFRYVEVYEPISMSPDFTGDGIVDIKDLIILIHHWGEDYSLCDIDPMPWGDGIVGVQDLEVLMSYWGQPVDDPTLIAHWALDEAEGDIAVDSVSDTGYSNGYALGNPLWQPDGGIIDGAIQLDGVDDYIITPPVLNPANGPFSILAWIKSGATGQTIISEPSGVNWISTDSIDGSLMTELRSPGPSGVLLLSETVITDNQWHRIGFIWDGFSRALYVDGVAVAEDTQDSLEGSGSGLYIGTGKGMEPGTYWSGLIDDVRIYNRAIIP